MAVLYIGIWFLTYQRLTTPGMVARMSLAARIIANKSPDPATIRSILATTAQEATRNAGRSYRFFDSASKSSAEIESEFIEGAVELAKVDSGDVRFRECLRKLDDAGAHWSDGPHRIPGFWERFCKDFYANLGVSFRRPPGDLADMRATAAKYLNFEYLPPGEPNRLDLYDRARLWKLLAFYDHKRVDLNDAIPPAMATLALAAGFFARFLYADFFVLRRSRYKDGSVQRKRPRWVPLWSFSIDHPELTYRGARATLIDAALILMASAAVAAELSLNDPELRSEWLLNVPIIALTGIFVIALIYLGTWFIRIRFNRDLCRYSREFRMRLFSPLKWGLWCSIVAILWMVGFSTLRLLPASNRKIEARAIGQIALGVALIVFLVIVLARVSSDLQVVVDADRRVSPEAEKDLNQPDETMCTLIFGRADERILTAILIAVLPLLKLFL